METSKEFLPEIIHAATEARVYQFGREFGERTENERTLGESRMREGEAVPVAAEVVPEQQVEVDDTRAISLCPHPAQLRLDVEKGGEQLLWLEACREFHNPVQKARLLLEVHRRGVVEVGTLERGSREFRETEGSGLDRPGAVVQIAAERHEGRVKEGLHRDGYRMA